MLLVLAGMEMPESPLHPWNAPLPIVVTPAGTAMEPRLLQFSNAPLPILLIEEEIATLVNAEQPLNVLLGMELTDACILTDDSLVHPENTPVPSDDTLPGTVTEVSPVQFENALFPMLVTEEGIDTAVIFDFPEKAPAAIAVAVSGIVILPPLPVYPVTVVPLIVNPAVLVFVVDAITGFAGRSIAQTTNIVRLTRCTALNNFIMVYISPICCS